jgi:hypothetical protein
MQKAETAAVEGTRSHTSRPRMQRALSLPPESKTATPRARVATVAMTRMSSYYWPDAGRAAIRGDRQPS